MSERKLASIQRIGSISPIEGADRIEQVRVMGWTTVVPKGEFSDQDLCVFCEIDSILPSDNPRFNFMEKNKYRVRTRKLLGIISQGLVLSTDVLVEKGFHPASFHEGTDVTEVLGITKYEPPLKFTSGEPKGNFPFYVPKTDVIRIQSAMEMLDELQGLPYNITVKYDGTSATFTLKDGEFNACSRNLSWKESESSIYWAIAKKYNIQEKLGLMGKNLAIQGEICGPGIQKNHLGLKQTELFVFDIYDIDNQKYIPFLERVDIIKELQIGSPVKPLIAGDNFNFPFDFLLSYSGKHKYDNGHLIEGIVIRPNEDMESSSQKERLIFKIVNPDYLISIGE